MQFSHGPVCGTSFFLDGNGVCGDGFRVSLPCRVRAPDRVCGNASLSPQAPTLKKKRKRWPAHFCSRPTRAATPRTTIQQTKRQKGHGHGRSTRADESSRRAQPCAQRGVRHRARGPICVRPLHNFDAGPWVLAAHGALCRRAGRRRVQRVWPVRRPVARRQRHRRVSS